MVGKPVLQASTASGVRKVAPQGRGQDQRNNGARIPRTRQKRARHAKNATENSLAERC
jgi:hypothetical protein